MSKTNIEYLTYTYNPIVMRCSRVSEGCRHCWHLRMCDRMKVNPSIPVWKQDIYAGKAESQIDEKALVQPIHVKKPSVFGVQFMGDLFHESVHNEMIKDVFDVIRIESRHRFLVLTKRPQRLFDLSLQIDYKLPNLWLGVSIEDQESAKRIWKLLETPAAHRWVSVEPMIGPVDLNELECLIDKTRFQHTIGSYLDWVVCGGETGRGARPMYPDWVKSLRDQCQASRVPFYFKQSGTIGNHTRYLDGRTWEEVPW